MVAYAGLVGTWERLSCELRPGASSAGIRLFSKKYEHAKARCWLFGVYEPLRDFEKSAAWTKTGILYGYATGGGLEAWVGM